MPSGILRWEDPAPTSNDEYDPIARELRNNPGRWAVIAEIPHGEDGRRASARLYNAVKNGYRAFKVNGGTYRAATRTGVSADGKKIIRVHAQYIPDRQ